MKKLGWIVTVLVLCASGRVTAAEAISDYGTTAATGYTDGGAGFGFTPLTTLRVTALGYSQVGIEEYAPSFQVSLWDSGGNLLSTALITNTDSTYNQSYYQTVSPLTLDAGVTYFIGAVAPEYGLWLGNADLFGYGAGTFSVSPVITYSGMATGSNIWEGLQPDTTTELFIGPDFQYAVVPQLTIIRSRTNVVLSWPTNATGFTLQSTTNLSPAAWSTNLPSPVVVTGRYTVTNPIFGGQMFYELKQ